MEFSLVVFLCYIIYTPLCQIFINVIIFGGQFTVLILLNMFSPSSSYVLSLSLKAKYYRRPFLFKHPVLLLFSPDLS
jgi:hypothetical protein